MPPTDGVQHTVTEAGLTTITAVVPILGQIVSDSVRGELARRAAERQRQFDLLVAERVDATRHRLEEIRADVDQVMTLLASDEFLSAFSKASRAAQETSSEAKRLWLATAAARFAEPGGYEAVRKERLLDVVERLDDLDVTLLQYLDNPYLWLAERDANVRSLPYVRGTLLGKFFEHMPANAELRPMVEISLGRLSAEGLSNAPATGTVTSGGGIMEKHSTPAGEMFLDFIGARLTP